MATERAREAGTLDVGLETLRGDHIVAGKAEELRTCPKTKAITSLVPLTVERSIHYLSAAGALMEHQNLVPMENVQSGKFALIASRPRSAYGDDGELILERWCIRPQKKHIMVEVTFNKSNWEICSKERFIKGWDDEVQSLPTLERSKLYLLTGLILPIWQKVPGENARIYRAMLDNGDALLGRALSEDEAAIIRGEFLSFDHRTAEGVITAVRSGRQQVDIGAGLKLVQRRIAGNQRLEIEGADRDTVQWLKSLGCFTEIHQYQLRVFLPNDDRAEGVVASVIASGSEALQAA